MVTKNKKILNKFNISKRKNKRKKTLKRFKGGAATALGTVAAGIAGTALSGASGLNIGRRVEEAASKLASPIRRGISDTGTVATEVVSGIGSTISSMKDVIKQKFLTTMEKIKDNTNVSKDGINLINYCNNYKRNKNIDEFKEKVKGIGNGLQLCLSKEDKQNRKYPYLFTVFKILGYEDNLKKALEFVLNTAKFSKNDILNVIDHKETNCIHYCAHRGLLNGLKLVLDTDNYLDDESKDYSLNCWNKYNYNPLHYALKGNHNNNPDIVSFLLDQDTKGYYRSNQTNLDDSSKLYSTFLLNQKRNKKYNILLDMMKVLIDENLMLPIGKDFVDTNSRNIFNDMLKYIQEKELQYVLQLSHLNDHSVNFYQCPDHDVSQLANEDISNEHIEFNSDSDNEGDIDEDGDKFENTPKEIEVFSTTEDIENSKDENLKGDIITNKIPSGEDIKILEEQGEYKKIKYGPTEGWIRKFDLLTPEK